MEIQAVDVQHNGTVTIRWDEFCWVLDCYDGVTSWMVEMTTMDLLNVATMLAQSAAWSGNGLPLGLLHRINVELSTEVQRGWVVSVRWNCKDRLWYLLLDRNYEHEWLEISDDQMRQLSTMLLQTALAGKG
jgi:hypothetical protein